MGKIAYYPGCSLGATAKEFGESTVAIGPLLGLELVEIEDWNCCGASSGHTTDPDLGVGLPARVIALAREQGMTEIVVPCVGCYKMLRQAQHQLKDDPERRARIEKLTGHAFPLDVSVLHVAELLVRDDVLDRMRSGLKRPLKGVKLAPYNGCVGFPPSIMGIPEYENPKSMDRVIEALGGEAVDWPGKVECCGGNLSLTKSHVVFDLVGRLSGWACAAGAAAFVTACPLCQSNLEMRQARALKKLPAIFITELIGFAMGHPDYSLWWHRHLIPVAGVFEG